MSFWRGRSVLVTGHTGFKGAWLVQWLHAMGAHVTGFALDLPTAPSLFELARVSELCVDLRGDVRDANACRDAVVRARPSVVLHLAAQSLVRRSYEVPLETFATNVRGTANLLEVLRDVDGVESVVVVTTDKVYRPAPQPRAHKEDDPLGGHDPYSASKACAEVVAESYRASYFDGALVATARAGNVIGGGDYAADRLVPDLVAAIASNEQVRLRYPGAVRPWQFVLEPLCGYLVLAERLASDPTVARAWNFGPGDEAFMTVAEMAETIGAEWNAWPGWTAAQGEHPAENPDLRLDSSNAARELGVKPRLSAREACEWTASWYRRRAEGEDARTLCAEQLAAFARVAS